ncbi:unnamed protein product, partial [Mesorhabditis spiculigera]
MSWRGDSSLPYDPRAGRNAFKNDDDGTEHPLARTARAMRSFTESIDMDMPPAPELPASLDIDRYEHGMKNSDTNDTIIEVKRDDPIDLTLGETQKFKMVVPGPGHTEQETEMHKSLLRDADQDSLDSELEALDDATKNKETQPAAPAAKEAPRKMQDPDHTALRQQYSVTALTRPRPTTPTQQCAIESFAFISQEEEERQERERQEKIKVKIPAGGKRRKSDMSYSEFYDSMSSQIPTQQSADSAQPIGDFHPDDPALTAPSWADFEASAPELPPSESGFFSKDSEGTSTVTKAGDPFAMPPKEDPFAAPADANLLMMLVEGHVTKYGLPLEHSAQCNVLLKFGSLNADELQSFVNTIEDVLFKCPAKRDTKPQYKQDEVQIHCYDEYTAHVDKLGIVSDQRAR